MTEPNKTKETEFERFWNVWPAKKGKPAAKRSFDKVWKEADAIISGVEYYKRTKPRDRPWLNPATFLNQRRWEDEEPETQFYESSREKRPDCFVTSMPPSRF